MKRIALDIDGVVIDLAPAIKYYIKKLYDFDWDPYARRTYELEKSTGLTKEEVNRCIDASIADMSKQVLIPGSKKFIKKCKQPVLFVTNRWDKENTHKFFRKKFFNIKYKIDFTSNSKLKILLKNKVTHFVEDRIDLANEAGKAGITVYLFDSCHNQEKVAENVIRVKNWKEIDSLFFQEKERKNGESLTCGKS